MQSIGRLLLPSDANNGAFCGLWARDSVALARVGVPIHMIHNCPQIFTEKEKNQKKKRTGR